MDHRDVEILEWPEEEARRQDLGDRGVLRLLRIRADVGPPVLLDDGEDWIRLPCSTEDQHARIRSLRAREPVMQPRPPRIDADGILRAGNRRCLLSPVEAQLMRVLVANDPNVTSRRDLIAAGWTDGHATRNALDLAMMRLRRTVEPYGVMIQTVRSRGYLVDFGMKRHGFDV